MYQTTPLTEENTMEGGQYPPMANVTSAPTVATWVSASCQRIWRTAAGGRPVTRGRMEYMAANTAKLAQPKKATWEWAWMTLASRRNGSGNSPANRAR